MNFSSSPAYNCSFATVAVMVMGINRWRIEEELENITTNNQQRREQLSNASSLGHYQERAEARDCNLQSPGDLQSFC